MTANQHRAVHLAIQILDVGSNEKDLSEADWHLLLLAAGLNNVSADVEGVAKRALRNAIANSGYFEKGALPETRYRITWRSPRPMEAGGKS